MKKIIFLIIVLLIISSSVVLSKTLVNKEDHEHQMTEIPEVAATCTQEGTKAYYTCGVCFKLYSDKEGKNKINAPEVIEKSAHTEVVDAAVEPTCIESGKTEGKHCSVCNEVIVKQLIRTKLGHTYSNYQSNNDATCLADGTETSKCDRCDVTDSRVAVDSKLGHTYSNYQSNNDATCLADGTKTAKCDRCDVTDTQADVGSKKDHTYNQENTELDGALKSVSGCDSPAVYYKSCICGALSDSETFTSGSAVGHIYTEQIQDEAHKKTSATDCQTKESYWYDCANCDSISDKLFYETDNVGGHSVSDVWTTEDGYHFNKCTVAGCDYVENKAQCSDVDTDSNHKCDVCEADGVSAHAYGEWANSDADNHQKICNCGDVVTEAHVWNETGRVEATHISEGSVSYECSCGATKTETILALSGHQYIQADINIPGALVSEATCSSPAVYKKSCICGELSENDTFEFGTLKEHSYGEATYSWSDDNSTCTASRVCSADSSHVESESASAAVETTQATCKTEGNTKYTASFNNSAFEEQIKNVAVPTTGHLDVEPNDFLCDGCGIIIEDDGITKNEYIFTVQKDDPFSKLNGGSAEDTVTTDGKVLKNTGEYYENTYGCTFTVNINVSEATVIDLYWIINNKKADASVARVIDKILVNGVDVTEISRIDTSMPKTTDWNAATANTVLVAKLVLKAGVNEITIVRNTDNNSESFNNINIRGLRIDSAVELSFPRYDFSLPEVDPFDTKNGGYTDNTTPVTHASNGVYYENTYGKTFSFTIVSDKATTAELALHLNHNKTASDVATTIEKVVVNGVEVELINSPVPKTNSWNLADSIYVHIASVELKEGLNTVDIVRKAKAADADQTAIDKNNLNIRGIRIGCTTAISLAQPYEFSVGGDDEATRHTNDPFVAENGGSTSKASAFKAENGVYRYGDGGGVVLTTTVYVEKDTTVIFRLINDCRPGEYFSYYQNENDGSTNYPYISYLTLNGSTEGVTPSTKTYLSQGWNKFMHCELATLELKAGINTITLRIAAKDGEEGGDNINYRGISFISEIPVSLPKYTETSTYKVTDDNPFATENGGSADGLSLKTDGNGTYYESSYNKTFTITVNVEENTVANFYLLTNTRFASVTTETTVSSISVTNNGESGSVVRYLNSIPAPGWNTANASEVLYATIELKAGTNVITFTRTENMHISAEDKNPSNINISGVKFVASVPVLLGEAE